MVQESIKKVTSMEEKTRNQSKKIVNRENGAQQNELLNMKENYSPSTAPLTWVPRIYIQELMLMKDKLDNMGRREKLKNAKEVEVINNINMLERENKALKEHVSKLQNLASMERGKQGAPSTHSRQGNLQTKLLFLNP